MDNLNKQKNQIDMLNGPLLKKMVAFALPIMLTSTLHQMFNAVDVAIVGRFAGPQAMAAVGSNSPIINLIVNLLVGMSVGANVVIAMYIGQGRRDKVNDAVHTTVFIALFGGALFGLIGVIASGPILQAMNSPEDVIGLATRYLQIYFCGVPLMTAYNFCASILRSKGDTLRPLYCLVASGVIKVGLNLLFVAVFKWSVVGVAVATLIANAISAGLVIMILRREPGEFRLQLKKLRLYREHLVRIVRIGLPSGIQGMVFSLSNIFIQAAVNGFGSEAVAGSSAAMNFEYICFFVLNAFSQTTMTFTSQNYGAGQMKRCRRVFLIGMIMGTACTMVCDFGFCALKVPLIACFTSVPGVAAWAYIRMRCVLFFQWMINSYEISSAAMRGMGHSMVPAAITIFGTCVLRIVWIFTIFKCSDSFEMLMYVYPVTWVITGAAVLTAYFIVRRKEERNAVMKDCSNGGAQA